jgi:hypothetical protein
MARAFDGGAPPVVSLPPGAAPCTSGADCAAGEICLNGGCVVRQAAGGLTTGETGATTQPVQPVTATAVPGTTPVTAPQTTPPATGVGGLIQPGAPLPARIYAGRCGALGADPAFQLIDVAPVEREQTAEAPQGALTAIPAELSTTVVNTTLADLLATEFAIDVRVDDADPATSIACGDIGGLVESDTEGNELAIGLQERGQSAYSGVAWLQAEDDRTLVRVFLARGLNESVGAAQPQVEPTAAPAEIVEPTATPAPAAVEAPQAAATPVIAGLSPLGPGTSVVTTIDVNLRAEPSEDAPVVTILGTGVQLDVTGTPENGWVPVVEPSSGQRGFISDQFITIVP